MRDKNGRFLPGISGNPGGRPQEVGDVREMARDHTEEAIKTLVDLMRHAKSDAARGAAAQALWIVATASPWRSPWTWWTMARSTSRRCVS